MATERAPEIHSNHLEWRRLWQFPVLLVGTIAMMAAWLIRPLWHDPAARQLADDLAAIRAALEPESFDTAKALAVGEDLLDQVDRFPERAGEIHFLVGSAYLRRAHEASRPQMGPILNKAKSHLEDAVKLGVSESEFPRLHYRLARVRYLTNTDPATTLEMLMKLPESAADSAMEHLEMLTELQMRLPQPNIQAALEANARQLALPTQDEDVLAPARLLRGELLIRLNQREEARKVLARIRKSSPPGVYVRARALRAQLSQQDRQWSEAAKLWEEILKDSAHPVPEPGRVKFVLGVCYRHLEQPRDAARLWESAVGDDAESSQAAALALADLLLGGATPGQAVDWLERALRDIRVAADFRNRLIDLPEVGRIIETGVQALVKAGDFARAHRLTELYEPLDRDSSRQWKARVSHEWASDCEKRAAQTSGATAARLTEEAARHFRDAAQAYASLAQIGNPNQPKWLWQSANALMRAKDYANAVETLQSYTRVESEPEKLGLAWATLADVHRAAGNHAAARSAYLKCIEYPGAYAFRARYHLAASEINEARKNNDQLKLDDAARALEHNLDLMRFAPDDEAYEQSLIALAQLLLERGNTRLAVIRFQEVLNRYPGTPRSLAIRLQLADCYRRLAAQDEQTTKAGAALPGDSQGSQQRRRWLLSAAANYQKIIDDLSARAGSGPLPSAEEVILGQALNAAAECHFDQGQFAEAISYYEELAVRYRTQPDCIRALKQAVRCYWFLAGTASEGQRPFFKNKAQETIQRVRVALKDLPDTAFGEGPGLLSRQEQEHWVEWAWKQ